MEDYTKQRTTETLDENFLNAHKLKVEAFETKCQSTKKLFIEMKNKGMQKNLKLWETLLQTIDDDYIDVRGSLVYEPEPNKSEVLRLFNSVKDTLLIEHLKSILEKLNNGLIHDFDEFERKSFNSINNDFRRDIPFLKDSVRGKTYEQIFKFIKIDEKGNPVFDPTTQSPIKGRPRF